MRTMLGRLIVWCGAYAAIGFWPATGRAAAPDRPTPTRDVGVARVDITPDYPVRMTGYANRKTEFEGVEQRLWAKALAIGSDAEGPAVLLTVDNLGVPASMTDEVASRVARKYPVVRERLVICASHTHCAPALEGVAPLIFIGEPNTEHLEHIARYTRDLTDRLEQVALAALKDRQPGRLSWASGSVDFAVNRRLVRNGQVRFGITPYPEGPVDHALPVLLVARPDDRLRAVLVNYACHCTTLGGNFNRVCGDWAGYAQEIIERQMPGVVAMVSIGCGADANPQPRDDLVYAKLHGAAVAREVHGLTRMVSPWRPITAPLTARREALELPFDVLPTREEFERRAKLSGPIAQHARVQLARLDRGQKLPETLPYQISVWQFGDDMTMVFLAGEVVVDYALRLKRQYDGSRLWITAYANDDPCYIASRRVLGEGGYEVDASMYYYDRPTHFAPEVEDRIFAALGRLLPASYIKEEETGTSRR